MHLEHIYVNLIGKVLDFRYSSDETEDESDMFREKGVSQVISLKY